MLAGQMCWLSSSKSAHAGGKLFLALQLGCRHHHLPEETVLGKPLSAVRIGCTSGLEGVLGRRRLHRHLREKLLYFVMITYQLSHDS